MVRRRQTNFHVDRQIFVLVNRFIKYTGYGNAAGLLYDYGLYHSGQNNHFEHYSSDSDESDTEIYKSYRDNYE